MALPDTPLAFAGKFSDTLGQFAERTGLLSPESLGLVGDILGMIGMACVVAAYLALEKGYVSNAQLRYYVANLVGALLLIASLLINFNLGSFVIELFWVAISLMGIARCLRRRGT